jgi:hypothetical protein
VEATVIALRILAGYSWSSSRWVAPRTFNLGALDRNFRELHRIFIGFASAPRPDGTIEELDGEDQIVSSKTSLAPGASVAMVHCHALPHDQGPLR